MIANEHEIYKTLKDLGFTDFATAGIMANLYCESRFKPDNVQNSYEKIVGNNVDYTKKVNNGDLHIEQFANDCAGYGLAQWTEYSRKKGLYAFIMARSKDISNLYDQLAFLRLECQNSGLYGKLNKCTSPYDAGVLFMLKFERPKNQTAQAQKNRGELATRFYNDNVSSVSIANQKSNLYKLFEMVSDTIAGKYGNGEDRKKALGKDYSIVQMIINYIM